MGTVLARALVKMCAAKNIVICEKNKTYHKKLKSLGSAISVTDKTQACGDADIVFLAVKPQDFSSLQIVLKEDVMVCSIMAGVSIKNIEKILKSKKVIRMMPNIAARVSEGFTAWTATEKVSVGEKKWTQDFLENIGAELYVKNEDKINRVTAITGSGPAYVFFVLSSFVKSAKKLGFSEGEARLMVAQVLKGVKILSEENSDFDDFVKQIASKGGTTEAALNIFKDANTELVWARAVEAAYKRAIKLSKLN